MDIELKELSNIYLQTLKEEEDGAAGEGQNPQQSVDVGSHAKSIRYQARRDNVPLPKAFNDYVAKNQLSGAERTALRQKLGFMESTELSEKKGCNHTHKGEECEVHGKEECPSMPVKEEDTYKSKDKIMDKAKPLHKHLYKNLHKGDTEGDVNESRHFSWREELRELVDVTSSKPKTDEKSREKISEKKLDKYGRAYSTGKRKSSIARVWLRLGKGNIQINGKKENEYFSSKSHRLVLNQPLLHAKRQAEVDVIFGFVCRKS